VLSSGCFGTSRERVAGTRAQTSTESASKSATGTPSSTAERPTYDCDAADRPPTPELDADPPGDAERYTYPDRPESLSTEEMRSYVERYEQAYRLNTLHSEWEANLNHASVVVEETDTYDAPDGTAIAQVKYTYDAEIEGDDGPIEIDSPRMYASYYVDDTVVLRAIDTEHQEDASRLIADPIEQGRPVECF